MEIATMNISEATCQSDRPVQVSLCVSFFHPYVFPYGSHTASMEQDRVAVATTSRLTGDARNECDPPEGEKYKKPPPSTPDRYRFNVFVYMYYKTIVIFCVAGRTVGLWAQNSSTILHEGIYSLYFI